MKKYNFDEIIDRTGTNCLKWDLRSRFFKTDDVLPLWVADTDFRSPDFIVDAIRERAGHELFGYSFRPDSYYEAIISWMKRQHGWDIEKDWISFSPGVVSALAFAIETFSKPGDGVVVQPPVYFPFFDCVKGTKRKMVENPLKLRDGRYYFDIDDLKAKIDGDTKILLLCSPQNPGGMVWSEEELTELGNVCLENNILVVSDEIHSDLVYKGYKHTPVATISGELAKNCVICMAPSKTFNIAGLSSSIVIIPDKVKFARYERALNVGHIGMGNIFGTVAMEAAYSHGDGWLRQLLEYIQGNYQFLEGFFEQNLPKVKVMKPEATYLVWLDFNAYGMSDKELFKFMAEKAKVGLNNGGRFGTGGEGYVRINIGCPGSILEEALERIKAAFQSI
ncbi:Cystathionine beta-lyase [hydrothermal vent metagenome]|uniref:cysteine-S-conjugate beta-lyase n=1 Tax=hydrothermal vent metagenome TaxID=652676 RepID=A0A3B0U7U1_9ZZZZ